MEVVAKTVDNFRHTFDNYMEQCKTSKFHYYCIGPNLNFSMFTIILFIVCTCTCLHWQRILIESDLHENMIIFSDFFEQYFRWKLEGRENKWKLFDWLITGNFCGSIWDNGESVNIPSGVPSYHSFPANVCHSSIFALFASKYFCVFSKMQSKFH